MSQENANENSYRRPHFRGGLTEAEVYWHNRQPWLEQCGYMLRPRYRPGWKPSWEGTNKSYIQCEDGRSLEHPDILDATRISDDIMVTLKKTSKSVHPFEADIGRLFSSEPLRHSPDNHCVTIYDVLQDPEEGDSLILVMPLLRTYNDPRFETVGEAIEFLRQLIEGLRFMHQNHVAHRDIMSLNVMMDPRNMFPDMYHPIVTYKKLDFSEDVDRHHTRTECPTTYYFVDFGHARKYDPEIGPPLEMPLFGGDKTVPEFQKDGYNKPSNPFPTDIYYLGNLFREDFLRKYHGLEFMDTLVAEMVQDDPSKRPTIDEVASQFQDIMRKVSTWKARMRLVSRKEDVVTRVFKHTRHVFRTARYVLKRLPPIPTSSPETQS